MNKDYVTLFILMGLFGASLLDTVSDLRHGASSEHLAQQAVLIVMASLGLSWIGFDLQQQRQKVQALRQQLQTRSKPSSDPQLMEARREFKEAVHSQFEKWELSASEREIGWLLLKGLSTKEIASLRGTQEKTTRQQASTLYRKANLPGRHAFSAWFIEDLI